MKNDLKDSEDFDGFNVNKAEKAEHFKRIVFLKKLASETDKLAEHNNVFIEDFNGSRLIETNNSNHSKEIINEVGAEASLPTRRVTRSTGIPLNIPHVQPRVLERRKLGKEKKIISEST